MESASQLAGRLKGVILDSTWIARTNFKTLLSDVTLDEANQKVGSLNTLALLTFHVNYYIEGLVNVFQGGDLEIRDKYSFDMPPVTSNEAWNALRNRLYNNAQAFAGHVSRMSEEALEAPFFMEEYGTYRRNIEAMVEHSYYHMGQISLIKKMIRES